jgi:hypothetical protein
VTEAPLLPPAALGIEACAAGTLVAPLAPIRCEIPRDIVSERRRHSIERRNRQRPQALGLWDERSRTLAQRKPSWSHSSCASFACAALAASTTASYAAPFLPEIVSWFVFPTLAITESQLRIVSLDDVKTLDAIIAPAAREADSRRPERLPSSLAAVHRFCDGCERLLARLAAISASEADETNSIDRNPGNVKTVNLVDYIRRARYR